MKPRMWKRNSFWLVLSLALMVLSSIVASVVQTSGYAVDMKTMRWETASGESISALLFKPNNVTADNKAPVIVVAHGWWNNKEMQDANWVELAKRGYVVIAIDMYGHGNSDYLIASDLTLGATGLYDGVLLATTLPYVDQSKIGVSGHSNGGRAINFAINIDNAADEQLIDAAYFVDFDPQYTDPDNNNEYFNLFGDRDIGLNADQYDEFFFRSFNAQGEELTPPREYIGTPNAQSFLHYGADPTTVTDERTADVYYTDGPGGAIRVVHTPAQEHAWGTISKYTVARQLEFWDRVFGEPNPIDSEAQTWQIKETATTFGLIGFAIFLLAFARALLGTRAFAGLRLQAPLVVAPNTRTGLIWFWAAMAVTAIVSGITYFLFSMNLWVESIAQNVTPSIFIQGAVFFIAFWAAVNGAAGIVIIAIFYLGYGRRHGMKPGVGLLPGWGKFFQGLGLSILTVAAAFGIVFFLAYFFNTDFRFWVLAVKVFGADKLWIALLYVPFFLLYFLVNSIAINVFNRFTLAGKEWLNTAVLAFVNILGPLVLVVWQYTTFFITGDTIPGFNGIYTIWLFPVLVILAASAVLARKIYRVTGNPYIGGFINAMVVTIIAVTNTMTAVYASTV